MRQTFIEAGKIRNTHALRGEVKFECWLDGENPLKGITHLYRSFKDTEPLKVLKVRVQGDVLLVLFDGVDSVEKATLLKGKTLFAAREELDPQGEKIFFADLVGLELREAGENTLYGTVREVTSRGGGELLVIRTPEEKEYYFPMVKEWIVEMDPERGIFVHAPEGLFE